jgi:hypothetical protein
MIFWFEEFFVFNFYFLVSLYLGILLLGQLRRSRFSDPDFVIATFSPVVLLLIKELKINSLEINPESTEIVILNIIIFSTFLLCLVGISIVSKTQKGLFKSPSLATYSFQIFLGLLIIFERLSDLNLILLLVSSTVGLVILTLMFKHYFSNLENTITSLILLFVIYLTVERYQLSRLLETFTLELVVSITLILYIIYWFTIRFYSKENVSPYVFIWDIIVLNSLFIFINKFDILLQPWVTGIFYLVINFLLLIILLLNFKNTFERKNFIILVNLLEIFLVLSYSILHQVNVLFSVELFFSVNKPVDTEIAVIWFINLLVWFLMLYYSLKYSSSLEIKNNLLSNIKLNLPLVFLSGLVINLSNFALWFLDFTSAGFLMSISILMTIFLIIIYSIISSQIEQTSNTLIGLYGWLLIIFVAFFSNISILSGIIAILGTFIWVAKNELNYHEYHNYISLFFIGIAIIHFFLNFLINFTSLTIEFGLISFLIGLSLGGILYYNKFRNPKELDENLTSKPL